MLRLFWTDDQNSVLAENKHSRMAEKGKVHFGWKWFCPPV
jgi:hypothetical protein